MIKALFLVFNPVGAWDNIVQARRRWPTILLGYLLPLWLIAFVAEGYGLVHWGKPQGVISHIKVYTHSEALIFEILQLFLMLVIVVVSARLIKALGETFHGRNTFAQAFTVAAYGLSPFFTLRILDIFPGVSSWAYWGTWLVGIFLSLGLLYHGIPKVMLPDPAHALGLYLISCVFVTMVTGFVRFLTWSYLAGKFGKLDTLISNLVAHVPFLQSFDQMHFFK
jgi:hypothetical protein